MGELGEHRASLLNNSVPEVKISGGLEQGHNNGSLDIQSEPFEGHWLQSSKATTGRPTEDPEEEIPPEEMAGEELPVASNLEDSLQRDLEVEVVEMRWVLGTSGQVGAKQADASIPGYRGRLHCPSLWIPPASQRRGMLLVALSCSGSWYWEEK